MTDEEYAIAILGAFEKLVFTAERIALALEGLPNKRELLAGMARSSQGGSASTADSMSYAAGIIAACKQPKP
jgi:hypothetical protein